jgi:peptide/nickel transport system substrate-binding protein
MRTHRLRFAWGAAALSALLLTTMVADAAPAVSKAKKTIKKKVAKKTTKKATTATTVKTVRQIEAPVGSTPVTLKPRPTDFDPNGTLSLSHAAAPVSLDPDKNCLELWCYPIYDRLTTIDDKTIVQPMLATGWTFPNKGTMDMTLRNDVTFEDGTKFDATAVKANIERSKTVSGSLTAPLLRGISSVEAMSPTVVRFHLAYGGAELPALFAKKPGMMKSPKVLASGVSLDISTRGGGSGPYTVDSLTSGSKVVYKQSKMVLDGTYWDKAAGLLKELSWTYIPTAPQRINAVRSGDIDLAVATGVDTAGAKQLIARGDIKGRDASLQFQVLSLEMRQTRPPFDNLRFRQALEYAVDKAAFSSGLYSGDCNPATQFFTKSHWSYSPNVEGRYKYSRDVAEKMIKDSGIFNPTFTVQVDAGLTAPAQALQGILGDYGINMKIAAQVPGDTSFRDGQQDAIISVMGALDPATAVSTFYLPSGIWKLYNDADGSLAAAAAAAADPTISQAAATKLYDGIWQKVADQAVAVHLCNTHHVWIHTGKVANLQDLGFTFDGQVDPRYLYVRKK